MMLKLLDLFSGIGGFSLGLERSGAFETVAFCEIEPYCQKVLAKHWPKVPIYDDVRTITAERLAADGIAVDAICGGFPCQDISTAGKGAGLEGERSGLWYEYARIIGEVRPRYVIVENVSALLVRGLDRVLGTLAALGYDAEWHCIPASSIGAPHRRDRVWIVAYANEAHGKRERLSSGIQSGDARIRQCDFKASFMADTNSQWELQPQGRFSDERRWISDGCEDVADAVCSGRQGQRQSEQSEYSTPFINRETIKSEHGRFAYLWAVEPDVGRVVDGLPNRSHRLRALGNAVVPQIPELIGRAIAAREAA